MQLKRLWDITNKKMVFVKGPTGHECQLWVDEATDKMYYYDMAQWLEYTQSALNDGKTYGPTWKVVESDDEMGVYDTNNPTDLFIWESGDEVSYIFKDWNGTVLKEGKVNEGTTPTPPADPTRESTAQYTYTFAGWNPTVGPISKKTIYTATYTATVNQYTVTIQSNNTDLGTVDESSVTVDYGTAISSEGNVLTIGATEVTATAGATAEFTSWTVNGGALPATVTGDMTVLATFESNIVAVQSISNISVNNMWVGEGGNKTFTFDYLPANANDFSGISFVDSTYTSTSATYNNGTATVTVEGLNYTTTNPETVGIQLNGASAGSVDVDVRPYANIDIYPDGTAGSVSPSVYYIPYGGTIDSSDPFANPCTFNIYSDATSGTVADTVTLTITAESGYTFEEFSSNTGTEGYDPSYSREALTCMFNQNA